MRNSALGLIVGFGFGFVVAVHVGEDTECRQSVVHNGEAKCAIYINKDLINDVK